MSMTETAAEEYGQIAVGDALRNRRGETFRVVKVGDFSVVAISDQYGNTLAIPRHQFIERDFQKVGA